MFKIIEDGFVLDVDGKEIVRHTTEKPFIFVGKGDAEYKSIQGNFKITDYHESKIPLPYFRYTEKENLIAIEFFHYENSEKPHLTAVVTAVGNEVTMSFEHMADGFNRVWLRVRSDADEKIYGLGEQMSYLNLKGRNYPLWTGEPGVGRDPLSQVTLAANIHSQSGGDYYTVNYPQPTYISSKKYMLHLDASSYMEFDFRKDEYTEICCWQKPGYVKLYSYDTYEQLAEYVKSLFGTQPELPDWIYNGLIVGIQGGTQTMLDKLDMALNSGIPISGIFCQDWEGRRVTSFGKRLMWNWKWNEQEYPGLDKKIVELHERGIKFLGYCNPYLAIDGDLYALGSELDVFVKNSSGEEYIIDFGEFDCATVDLTNPKAFEWYKGVIRENMIDFGLDGWMADFGEYLPADAVLFDGTTGEISHNLWPTLWAKLNREVVDEAGRTGDIVFFMRSGFTGAQGYCPLLWAGDQSVDFSRHDGLISVVCGALSSGIVGGGIYHSDLGGYTSLYGIKRSKELLIRWTEMAAFMPVMRSHEGNRPDDNFQYYDDEDAAKTIAKLVKVYTKLSPYMKELVTENTTNGIGVVRPLFYYYDDDSIVWEIQDQFLCGRDILVAPVYEEGAVNRKVYLPKDDWIHLFTGERYSGGDVEVDTPLGIPCAFYRENSKYKSLFEEFKEIF